MPRGPLTAEEKANIALFESSKASVVYISTSERVLNFWTRNVMTVPRGTGSGFFWDDKGHIVTNLHVVNGAASANVRLADGRDYPAELVGLSEAHDIAVLKINIPSNPPAAIPVGTSADLQVGQKVFAIGNPFGLDWTLTTGIVSALDRSLTGDDGVVIQHLVQTDAAINPGNSGGPLLDSAGRLIGINTAIYSPSGASAGVGFAVPVDTVNRVVAQLIDTGHYAPPEPGHRDGRDAEPGHRPPARHRRRRGRARAPRKRGGQGRSAGRTAGPARPGRSGRRDYRGQRQVRGQRGPAAGHSRRLQTGHDREGLHLA